MSNLYDQFTRETRDVNGKLQHLDIVYPENFNFGYDVVDAIAAKEPDKRAVVWCNTTGEEHIFTFADISRLSNKAANVFLNAGIKKGDKVMVILKRHYEYWYVSVALHKIGAVMIPATHMLTARDIVYRVNNADIKALVCTSMNDVPKNVAEAMAEMHKTCPLWVVQADIDGFRNFTKDMETASENLERIENSAHDPMLLFFTSGTTDYPKGVVHDYTYPLSHIATAKHWQQVEENGLHFTVSDTGWGKASWGKIYGQWICGCAVMVYDFDNFDPKQLVNTINKYGVTSFCAPPTIYRYLVKKNLEAMPSLKHAATAGELLQPEVFHQFTEKTGLKIYAGYGQSETSLLLANFAWNDPQEGSLGFVSPMYQVALHNEDGTETKPGEIGEIVVIPPQKGAYVPGVFINYVDNDALYQKAWRDCVYHTGDSAWMDENGCYWFNGRLDDVIKTSGFRVGPYEVENVLMEHPAVMECTVIGVPDEKRGQAIKAIVVLAPGYEASKALEKELKEYCNSRLSIYKWIRILEFMEEMPKTISGKICKAVLKKK